MKKIAGYLTAFYFAANKKLLLCATAFAACLVFINYYFRINGAINRLPDSYEFAAWYLVFLTAFGGGYVLLFLFAKMKRPGRKQLSLVLLAPALFAWKMSISTDFNFTTDIFENEYWNAVVYWPLRLVVMLLLLRTVHSLYHRKEPFYGVSLQKFDARPYLWMLLIMVPLIAAAGTRPDFQAMYPRMQAVEFLYRPGHALHALLYEASYGSDFLSIELFFRGFLVLAFAWAGKEVVIPMALFYCTIHFGKPMGECISSYFGGLILGIVTYHTRTILGGFMVHVGIAWMMELAGAFPLNIPLSP